MPGAPPRKLEVEALNSTALRVTWKPPLQLKQHGQIRGYQVIYSRFENGEPRGQPILMDVALPEAQVQDDFSLFSSLFLSRFCLNRDYPVQTCDSFHSLLSSYCLISCLFPHTFLSYWVAHIELSFCRLQYPLFVFFKSFPTCDIWL